MFDTTPITIAITRMITAGTAEQALLAAVARQFPELTPAELSAAIQMAMTAAERYRSSGATRERGSAARNSTPSSSKRPTARSGSAKRSKTTASNSAAERRRSAG